MFSVICIFSVVIFLFSNICFAAPQKLDIVLDWFVNPDHAPIIVAKQQGFFRDENLDVTILQPSDPADPIKWLAAKQVDLAVDYQMHYLRAVNNGLPLVQVGTLIDHPLNALVVLKKSGITKLSQLKGKRIGYASDAADTEIVSTMLKKNGVQPNQVELINVHFGLSQALLSERVDAVVGMMRNYELLQLQMMGAPGRAFYPENNGVPKFSEMILVTRSELKNDPRIKRFMHAIEKAVIYLQAHPQKSWQQFIAAYPEQNNALNKKAWLATLPHFTKTPSKPHPKQSRRVAAFLGIKPADC